LSVSCTFHETDELEFLRIVLLRNPLNGTSKQYLQSSPEDGSTIIQNNLTKNTIKEA